MFLVSLHLIALYWLATLSQNLPYIKSCCLFREVCSCFSSVLVFSTNLLPFHYFSISSLHEILSRGLNVFLKRFSPTPPACYFSSRFSFAANSPLCFERYARVSHPICLLVFLKIVFASNSVAFFERVARTSEFSGHSPLML